jgi:pyruvate,water dikinase
MSTLAYVSWFGEVGLTDRPAVGGKGASLGELERAGLAVPPGFVVRTAAFERHLETIERESPLRARVAALNPDDLDAVAACSRELRACVEQMELPREVVAEVRHAWEALTARGAKAVAVRSSATTEDATDASFAGLQDTYLWVRSSDEVLEKLRSCWASLYSVESLDYRLRKQFPETSVAMAVVVQAMVDARSAGVMFTRSPTTGDRSVITIEGAWGLGSAVVGGEVTPDRWVIGKITGEISVRDVSDKAIQHRPIESGGIESLAVADSLRRAPCLSDDELQTLRAIGRKVESHYRSAQDIEWAVDRESGKVLVLQSRPETVWSARDPVPTARAAENPLAHVLSVFGGRK